jgi:peroxiredoxin
MANPLTGDFDAVVQVSVPTANRLLASMHQSYGNDADLPTLPHRKVVFIGDKPLGGSLTGIRGTARVQIGAPTVALIANAPRSANVSCWIRARYNPEPKSAPMPEFIHGKIVARFNIAEVKFYGTVIGIRASASADDAHITFNKSAESQLNTTDNQKITGLIRDFLRTRVNAFLKLPQGVPAAALAFQAVTDGQGRQALSLPIMINGGTSSSSNLGQVFLDKSDFAIAISKEFILELIQPAIDAINQTTPNFSVTATFGWGPFKYSQTAHYTVSMTAKANWKDGELTLGVSGTAETPHMLFPNATFNVSQTFALEFDATTQSVSLTAFSPAKVSVTVKGPLKHFVETKAENEVRAKFETERNKGLKKANQQIGAALALQREQLRKLLRKIDDAAELAITSIQSTDDGVLLRGKIGLSPRKVPRVEFSQLKDGSGYTAFESWVPGGQVRQFRWTWWRAADYVPGEAEGSIVLVPKTEDLFDRYILQKQNLPGLVSSPTPGTIPAPTGPAGYAVVSQEQINSLIPKDSSGIWIPPEGQLCLSIYWEHVSPLTGEMVTGGPEVEALNPGIACYLAVWWPPRYTEPVKFKNWPCPEVNVIVTQPGEAELVSEALLQAISQVGRADVAAMLVLALDIGRRGVSPVLVERARELRRRFPQLGVTFADRNQEWLGDLNLPADRSLAALRLVDPSGRLAWRHDGVAEISTIAAAMRKHFVAGFPPRGSLLQTAIRPGNYPPDFTFEVTRGEHINLRDLRGRQITLVFVTKGTASVEMVLRSLLAHANEIMNAQMVVIVVQDGQNSGSEVNLTPPRFDWIVVQDPESLIARSYGITIRPTTVLVDRDGRVGTVRMMSSAITLSGRTIH